MRKRRRFVSETASVYPPLSILSAGRVHSPILIRPVPFIVRTNLNYYKNLIQFIRDEKEEKYSKIYKAIKTKVEAYFETAAEDILMDVYGEKYLEFFEKTSAEFAKKAKKNSPKKNEE